MNYEEFEKKFPGIDFEEFWIERAEKFGLVGYYDDCDDAISVIYLDVNGKTYQADVESWRLADDQECQEEMREQNTELYAPGIDIIGYYVGTQNGKLDLAQYRDWRTTAPVETTEVLLASS